MNELNYYYFVLSSLFSFQSDQHSFGRIASDGVFLHPLVFSEICSVKDERSFSSQLGYKAQVYQQVLRYQHLQTCKVK